MMESQEYIKPDMEVIEITMGDDIMTVSNLGNATPYGGVGNARKRDFWEE